MNKVYMDKDWLSEKIASGETSRSLSKQLGVSYHLIEIYLDKYGIDYVPGKFV
jgi:hypothetical protein